MPNWCFSQVNISGKKKDIDLLEKRFNEALSSNPLNARLGNKWLGNLLYEIGLPEDQIVYGEPRCCGEVLDLWRDTEKSLRLDVESAWGPHLQCVKMFVDNCVGEGAVDILYSSDLFYTNDPSIEGTVYPDYYIGEEVTEDLREIIEGSWDVPAESLEKELAEYLGHPGTLESLGNEISEKLEEFSGDYYVNFHVYEYVPLSELG